MNDTFPLPTGAAGEGHYNPDYQWHQDPDGNWVPASGDSGGEAQPSDVLGKQPSPDIPQYNDTGNSPVNNYTPPVDYYGFTNSGVPLQLINDLGYNPSYPYGSSGSGVLTQRGFGIGGTLLGGGLGNAFLPIVGGPLGGTIGGRIGGWLGHLFNNWRNNPGTGGTGGGGRSSSSGGGDPAATYHYLEGLGYEPGQGTGSQWPGGGPTSGPFDVGAYGVGGGGGSFFHDLGGAGPLAGSFAGLGSFGAADPLSGAWGGINSPVARQALSGVPFNPALMPSPGFNWGNRVISAPGNMPIINPAAFGSQSSPGQSVHFLPKGVQ